MQSSKKYKIRTKVWLYNGSAAWHFVTIPKKIASELKFLKYFSRKAWGSIKVKVKIGDTEWDTSIFPDSKSGTYLLPIKKEIRKKENIIVDKTINLVLEV